MDNYYNPLQPGQEEAKRRYSKIGFAATIMAVLMVGLPYLVLWLVKNYFPEIKEYNWFLWAASVLPMYLVAVPVFLILVRSIPKSVPEKNGMSPGQWFTIIAIAATCMYGGNMISQTLMQIIGNITGKIPDNGLNEMLLNSNTLVNLAVVGIFAPVIEELVFRKVLIDRTRIFGEKTAIFFSALTFALFHGNFYQFFYAFGLGLILAYVYIRTGRIRNSIFLHMGINLTSGVLTAWLLQNIVAKLPEEFKSGNIQDIVAGITDETKMNAALEALVPAMPYIAGLLLYSFILFFMAITGFVLYLINMRKIDFRKTELELPREQIGGTVYWNAGVVAMIFICAIILVLSLAA
jgi:membrane protease YdiL (CAAX protease family)